MVPTELEDEDQYVIKEIVPQMSSLGRVFMTIHRFIVAPFLIGSSCVIGIGAGLVAVTYTLRRINYNIFDE